MGSNKNFSTAAIYQAASICETAVKNDGIFIKTVDYTTALKFRQEIYSARLLYLRQAIKKGSNTTDPIATVKMALSKDPPGIFIRPSHSLIGIEEITAINSGEIVEIQPVAVPETADLLQAYCAALERLNKGFNYKGSWAEEAQRIMAEGYSLQDVEDGIYSLSTEFLLSIAKK